MNRLNELLHDAAEGGEATFTVDDVARRVDRRRQRRRAGSALAVLLIVVGMAGLAVSSQQDADEEVAAPDGPAPLVEELTRTRWVLFAYSVVTVGTPNAPWLDFHDDRRLWGSTGCRDISADWSLDGDRLMVDDISFVPHPADEVEPTCDSRQQDAERNFLEVLESRPRIGPFDGDDDTLRFEPDPGTGSDQGDDSLGLGFLPFDSFETPTAAELDGDWTARDGTLVRFDADERVVSAGCGSGRWGLGDARLVISESTGCTRMVIDDVTYRPGASIGIDWSGRSSSELGLRGGRLYLSTSTALVELERPPIGGGRQPRAPED